MKRKPKIGVSSCLLGRNTRYDGGNRLDSVIVNVIGPHVEFVPVCPEAECGLGVPREKMHLEGDRKSPRLITSNTRVDLTDRMNDYCARRVSELGGEQLDGFIFKSKSPSCGLRSALVLDGGGISLPGSGLFAKVFIEKYPEIPATQESSLKDDGKRQKFLEEVFRHARIPFPKELKTTQ